MSDKKNEIPEIEKLGEFGLIKRLTEKIKLNNTSSLVGVGDDAAVLDYKDKKILISTDILTEGIHFDLMYTPLKHLGYKAVISNLSDIYAMNGTPEQIVISMAVSAKFDVEMIEEIYAGIQLACTDYGVDIVGGDTSSSLTGLTLSITVIGSANETDITYRSGAKKNDVICVSGDLGAAFIGLQLLEREKEIFKSGSGVQPDLSGYEYILERQLKPEARKDIVEKLKELGIKPTAMIDISDGLSSDLTHICEESNAGCKLFADKLPIDESTAETAEELNLEPVTIALNGGEDYELLFTIDIKDVEKISGLKEVTPIGHITDKEDGKHLITPEGNFIDLTAMGWNTFRE